MPERDQIITFLLQACDNYRRTIEQMQKTEAELRKQLAEVTGGSEATPAQAQVNGAPKAA